MRENISDNQFSKETYKFTYKIENAYRFIMSNDLLKILFLIILTMLLSIAVYLLNGSKMAVYFMYIPIIIAAFTLKPWKSSLVALIAGLLVGPYMPFDVRNGIMQEQGTWILRTIMFMVGTYLVSFLVGYIRKHEKNKANQDVVTGYPNYNKLKSDYEELCKKRDEENYSFIYFEFENLETINRFVDYNTGHKAYIKLLNMADMYFENGTVYVIGQSKFVLMIAHKDTEEVYAIARSFIHVTKQPIYIDSLPIAFIVKGAVDCDSPNGNSIEDIIARLGKSLELSCTTKQEITIYDDETSNERKAHYNALISIYRALKSDDFYMVYQPKISKGNDGNETVEGVEALLRWDNSAYGDIPISDVIKIAEDANFIKHITKWVIRNVMIQQKKWQSQGKKIMIAINISAVDLNNESVLKLVKECIETMQIDPTLIEFELTERSIIGNSEKAFSILNKMRDLGIKISLDDYGTGYNSLMNLVSDSFRFDYVKIDKKFIDEITKKNIRTLIEGIINSAHGLGIEIVAEGVETEEQLKVLKEINCDIIQGYYYSKPLLPSELEKFISKKLQIVS